MCSKAQAEKIVRELKCSVAPLFPNDKIDAILFGSYARGDMDAGSDIDVMLLVDSPRRAIAEKNWEVGSRAAELLLDYGVVVSPIVENRDYYHSNIDVFPFYSNIHSEGVYINA